MGATNGILLRMILLQAIMVGALGYGLGVGGASLFGYVLGGTELSFRLTKDLLFLSAGAIIVIIIFSALISIHKVMRLEPAIVFKG
jgi:putative ABC transport system permease protein